MRMCRELIKENSEELQQTLQSLCPVYPMGENTTAKEVEGSPDLKQRHSHLSGRNHSSPPKNRL